MFYKKLLALLCAAMMLMGIPCVQAEQAVSLTPSPSSGIPDKVYYKGGVVLQGFSKGSDTSARPLEIAYVLQNIPYIVLDQATRWELTVSGGTEPYACEALLCHQSDLSMDQFTDFWNTAAYFDIEGSEFEYTFTKPGRYFWEFQVTDANGQFLHFQTRVFEAYTEADEAKDTTVAGKVNSIIQEYITPDMSDYARARVLHDWLIHNANYDFTFTNYDAEGVLLKGTGVCDSYARAYLMLCTAAGLDCIIVTGTAGTPAQGYESHGWNMVKLDGKWYHVDCTWDDPGEGGFENHKYFCVSDETLSADHFWNKDGEVEDPIGVLPPASDGGKYESDSSASYQFTFSTLAEYEENFMALVNAGTKLNATTGKYVGSDLQSIYDGFGDTFGSIFDTLGSQWLILQGGVTINNDEFTIDLIWVSQDPHLMITADNAFVSINEEITVTPLQYAPNENAFTWSIDDPGVATVTGGFNTDPNDSIPDGPYAIVTGVSAGEATLTAAVAGGTGDTMTISVLPAHKPDFSLTLTETGADVLASWNAIPGVTEYRVYRTYNGADTLLATTAANSVQISPSDLPATVAQKVYVIGERKVGSEVVFSYTSNTVSYGKAVSITYTATLPAAVTVIDDDAFYGDVSLTSFEIPAGVTTIGNRVFYGCTDLTAVLIPASVQTIGSNVFDNCDLQYAEVTKGSYAEEYMITYYPEVELIY